MDANCPGSAPLCASTEENVCSGSAVSGICFDERSLVAKGDAGAATLSAPERNLPTRAITQSAECDDMNWCWEHPNAPGELFHALSSDGRFAVGEQGVVFDTSGRYLPRPASVGTLTAIVTHGDSIWVGGGAGIWRYTGEGWEQETDASITKMAIDQNGTAWAVGGDVLLRREDARWVSVALPENADYDSSPQLYDVVTVGNGNVWVVGGYSVWRFADATLFTYESNVWREFPSNQQIGIVYFLQGRDLPYVYSASTGQGQQPRVFAPTDGWKVLDSSAAPLIYSLFWGPDGQLWQTAENGLSPFGASGETMASVIGCQAAVPWDNDHQLCASSAGGLVYLSGSGDDVQTLPEYLAPTPYDAERFGTLPNPIWAQRAEAWAFDATDVWRAPLEHFDGEAWESRLTDGDPFVAIEIDGTAPNDVWFLGTSEVRHWNGEALEIADVPVSEGAEFAALRAVSATEVWALRRTLFQTPAIQILRFNGAEWQIAFDEHTSDGFALKVNTFGNYLAGSLAGTSNDLWAVYGQTVLHFDGRSWTQVWHFDTPDPEGVASEFLLDVATDGTQVWVLTRDHILEWQRGSFLERGHYSHELEHLALSDDFVWNFDGVNARRFAR